MNNDLHAENQLLRKQLQSLMDEARINEKKWRRLDQFEKKLISTRTLPELIRVILEDYKTACETDAVTLALCDPDDEIRRILERAKKGSAEMPGLVLLEKIYTGDPEPHPYLGDFDDQLERAIFDPWPNDCQSMVLLPLICQGKLIGSLNMASCSAERFSADSSTDFIERLANVFAICLENSLNHERLNLAGLTDPLTGLFNRRYFETRCQEEVANVRRHQSPLACMFLDIDKFKHINDTCGHSTGDEVLCNISMLIKSQLRSNDVLARFGGEEFVVLLPQTRLQHACEIAERIRTTIAAQPFQTSAGHKLAVTISIGVADVPDKLDDDNKIVTYEMMAAADKALYQAKESGRNQVASKESMPIAVSAKLQLGNLFRLS